MKFIEDKIASMENRDEDLTVEYIQNVNKALSDRKKKYQGFVVKECILLISIMNIWITSLCVLIKSLKKQKPSLVNTTKYKEN